jgi:hypothetical protein
LLDSDDATIARGARVIETRLTLPITLDALATAFITLLTFLFSALSARVVLAQITKILQETQEPVAIVFI